MISGLVFKTLLMTLLLLFLNVLSIMLFFSYHFLKALKPLRIRLGGSLQDQVVYNVGRLKSTGHPFRKMKNGLFGFSNGSLHMQRWDELNHFLNQTG